MHQVLFNIPVFTNWFPPDGIPIYGFGAMLFLTFVLCTYWGTRRGGAVGMPPEKVQDLFIWVFVAGIIGARILYMIQYANQFPDTSAGGLALAFFQIWRGGIIFYGSALGGAAGYGLFYWFVMRRMQHRVSAWQLADAVAPIVALGLAVGRIGCFLNGCCWGQVAVEEACSVPLGGAHFPLLPAHAREQLVRDQSLQTSTGFTTATPPRFGAAHDPRFVVDGVEPGSPAAAAGLKPGDKIVRVNDRQNAMVEVLGDKDGQALQALRNHASRVDEPTPDRTARVYFADFGDFVQATDAARKAAPGVSLVETDWLGELVRDWPRGKHDLKLTVDRGGQPVDLPAFTPRTVGLYPTQIYETISMLLLIVLLLAYYPYRRHDGQLFILCMMGYAVHRFINESLRIEPTIGNTPLTLSQWGSVVIFATAVGLESYLWRSKPSRWAAKPVDPQVVPTQTVNGVGGQHV